MNPYALQQELKENYLLFSKDLIHVCGIKPAALLTELLFKFNYYFEHNLLIEDKYFYMTERSIELEIALTVNEQKACRKVLRDLNLIETVRRGVPATLHYSINFDVVEELTKKAKEERQKLKDEYYPRCKQKGEQDDGKSTNQFGENPRTYIINNNINNNNNINMCNEDVAPRADEKENTKEQQSEELFLEFWKAYPNKKNKKKARLAFKRLKITRAKLNSLLQALEIQKNTEQWKKSNGQFIPHATTWLNGERWEDVEIIHTVENDKDEIEKQRRLQEQRRILQELEEPPELVHFPF